jgi:hypothetical protein
MKRRQGQRQGQGKNRTWNRCGIPLSDFAVAVETASNGMPGKDEQSGNE